MLHNVMLVFKEGINKGCEMFDGFVGEVRFQIELESDLEKSVGGKGTHI